MALQNQPTAQTEEIMFSATSMKSTFERLARRVRGQHPKIISAGAAKQISQEASLQILNHAVQAVSAQANFEIERTTALLESGNLG